METHQVKVHTELETRQVAAQLAVLLKPGDVVTLEGELGAGKTTFTKGLANGLGVKRHVSSPTFTIIKEYQGELPLYHMDVYRLENSEEDIGFDEYFNGDGICVVEWAQFINEFLPEERLEIEIQYAGEESRTIQFKAYGTHFEGILRDL
ncbi:tRNA (adenosine(37)-N6)-threonylcarbamoyltransferase complex ATPase subunit type 1 TsaE [Oceanobacillus jordanicus]|uniref:tRNA threonylcarbamoyladenosine biosynthesis protein TsaE n=1 Tax=Oceanobacillus jordanicus TaxID=2867266 RepID=A0AAW5BHB0_9BACI|nr:tRNA (adenosine(37)-N6)-threonylcarbamoyltransferase complex ATPase subunit type 1 TsaE [Oceanobacillus jordanicus]MCG3421264.1 tRNA (adenosine(37)-N6)-threonylcarbamoyltransferase complex ATPase subunit type 1 TsaE [Oceanobacillus jordanicus]